MQHRRPGSSLWAHNLAATVSTSTSGTTITASGSINTKGSWTQLYSSTAANVVGMTLCPLANTTASSAVTMLIDIGIGGAGSEVVKIPNLIIHNQVGNSTIGASHIPIFIPKGTRIAARCQSNTASKTASLICLLEYEGDHPAYWAAAGVETIGADTTTSTGLLLTTGAGSTFSSWTNIGSTTTRVLHAIKPFVGVGSDSTMNNRLGYIEVGINSTTYSRWVFQTTASESAGLVFPDRFFYRTIPSGSQLQVRAVVDTSADTDIGVQVLGLY